MTLREIPSNCGNLHNSALHIRRFPMQNSRRMTSVASPNAGGNNWPVAHVRQRVCELTWEIIGREESRYAASEAGSIPRMEFLRITGFL